jgi:hypothetical protein
MLLCDAVLQNRIAKLTLRGFSTGAVDVLESLRVERGAYGSSDHKGAAYVTCASA